MALSFLRTHQTKLQNYMKHRISQFACNSVLYNWSLGGEVPNSLLLSLPDIWAGSVENGRLLLETGVFMYERAQIPFVDADWDLHGVNDACYAYIHGHESLRDLKAVNGDSARIFARALVKDWIENYPIWDEKAWRADIIGRRISNWISFYGFFCESACDDFQFEFFESLARQARHLNRALATSSLSGLPLLYALKGLTYAGLTLEGRENCLEQALALLDKEIDKQILSDGGHISRNPQNLMEAIQILIDLRTAFQIANLRLNCQVPEKIQHALDRAVPALRFFRHADRRFALFHGTQKGNEEIIKTILLQSRSKGKTLSSLPHTGFERIAQGRALLIMDTGNTPPFTHDRQTHAAPLSFEFSYSRERVLVNCGSHVADENWRNALRFTPAHNALSIDDRNACEIAEDGHIHRRPRNVQSTREDLDGAVLIDAYHDGYVPINGVTHRRRIYMAEDGHDLRGEENLNCALGLSKPVSVALRFHLHPDVPVSLVNDGLEALLRVKNGPGWRFSACGGTLRLENSVYLGEGTRPRKTKQLVVYTTMAENTHQIKWALQQERV